MGKLDGKVAFITGAARGQGRSHAIRLAEEGADIIALDICTQIDTVTYEGSHPSDLEETVNYVEKTGRKIIAEQVDVRDFTAVRALADRAVAELGHIDIVLANAGIMPFAGEPAKTHQAWHDCIDVMLTGVFHTIDACLPAMLERDAGGAIVITSSLAGLKAMSRSPHSISPGLVGYHAAKHAVVGVMRLYANALAPVSIRVNTVHPTAVNTPMAANEEFQGWVAEHPELLSALQHPMPVQLIEPADVTNAVLYLVSDDGRYVTNTTMPVDAGMSGL